jgi:quercetin dioxygenase-like cupin family protein
MRAIGIWVWIKLELRDETMKAEKKNLAESFSKVNNYFSPKIVAEVNDVFVKIAKVKGEDVPWHIHDNEDEMFYIVRGSLVMELEGEDSFELGEGDFFVVDKGINHRVYSDDECWVMLIENKTTKHTGDVESKITKSIEEQY